MKGGECRATFAKRPSHAAKGDRVAWEFLNTCDNDQTVTLALHQKEENPFTDTSAPWTITARKDNENNPDTKELDVSSNAITGHEYKFDIMVGGKSYDPRLEIDP